MKKLTKVATTVCLITLMLTSVLAFSACGKENPLAFASYFEYEDIVYYNGKKLLEVEKDEHFYDNENGTAILLTDNNDYTEFTWYVGDKSYKCDFTNYSNIAPLKFNGSEAYVNADGAFYWADLAKGKIVKICDKEATDVVLSPNKKAVAFLTENAVYTWANNKLVEKDIKRDSIFHIVAVSNDGKMIYYRDQELVLYQFKKGGSWPICSKASGITFNKDLTQLLCINANGTMIFYQNGQTTTLEKDVQYYSVVFADKLEPAGVLVIKCIILDCKNLLSNPIYYTDTDGNAISFFANDGQKDTMVKNIDDYSTVSDGYIYIKNDKVRFIKSKKGAESVTIANHDEVEAISIGYNSNKICYSLDDGDLYYFDGKNYKKVDSNVEDEIIADYAGNFYYVNEYFAVKKLVNGKVHNIIADAEGIESYAVCIDGIYAVIDGEVYYCANNSTKAVRCN